MKQCACFSLARKISKCHHRGLTSGNEFFCDSVLHLLIFFKMACTCRIHCSTFVNWNPATLDFSMSHVMCPFLGQLNGPSWCDKDKNISLIETSHQSQMKTCCKSLMEKKFLTNQFTTRSVFIRVKSIFSLVNVCSQREVAEVKWGCRNFVVWHHHTTLSLFLLPVSHHNHHHQNDFRNRVLLWAELMCRAQLLANQEVATLHAVFQAIPQSRMPCSSWLTSLNFCFWLMCSQNSSELSTILACTTVLLLHLSSATQVVRGASALSS